MIAMSHGFEIIDCCCVVDSSEKICVELRIKNKNLNDNIKSLQNELSIVSGKALEYPVIEEFEDYVKLDVLVHVGHDAHLYKNVEITACGIVGGFTELEERAYMGLNATTRNRIRLGKNCIIGMGATVTKSVDDNITVVGNPARPFEKK